MKINATLTQHSDDLMISAASYDVTAFLGEGSDIVLVMCNTSSEDPFEAFKSGVTVDV